MLLTDFNFDTENETASAIAVATQDARVRQRDCYVPRMCSGDGTGQDFGGDVNGLKAQADLYFYRKQFSQCLEIYNRDVFMYIDKKIFNARRLKLF
jgi:hypothetical protein